MNRGQVLYRVAELMEGRRDQFVAEVATAEGLREAKAREIVARAIDRWVWYAGWADKIARSWARRTPSRRRTSTSRSRADRRRRRRRTRIRRRCWASSRALPRRWSPATPSSSSRPRRGPSRRDLTEVLATGDVPGGVVNVLTGLSELVPVLAGHVDVDAIDVWGVPDDLRTDVELVAADNVKRLARRPAGTTDADWLDDRASERPEWIAAFLEMKTVWRDQGLDVAVGTMQRNTPSADDRRSVERRVWVKASPRRVWTTLHDEAWPRLLAELTLRATDPSWPAAGSAGYGEGPSGLLRTAVSVESLEARPTPRSGWR